MATVGSIDLGYFAFALEVCPALDQFGGICPLLMGRWGMEWRGIWAGVPRLGTLSYLALLILKFGKINQLFKIS